MRPLALARLARAFVAVIATAVSAAVVLGTPAAAHTELRSTTPAEGETVEQLTEVVLEFSSALLEIGAELSIVDAAGDSHVLEPTFPSDDTVSAAVEGDIAAGDAELVWRVVAEDGHPIQGTVAFVHAPLAAADSGPSADASPEAEPTSAVPSASPEVSVTYPPMNDQSSDPGGVPAWALPVIGLAALASAVVAFFALRQRDRS